MSLSITECITQEPPALDEVLPGLLPGTVGSVIAPGGSGKSFLMLEALPVVAAGFDLTGALYPQEGLHSGRVTYLPAEDPEVILHHRIHALGKHLPPMVRETVAEKVTIEPLLGKSPNILEPAWEDALTRAAADSRLLMIDTLSRFHAGDENDGQDAKAIMRVLERVAAKTEAAVVYAHHTNKAAIRSGAGDEAIATRGHSSLVDDVRWQLNLSVMTQEEAKEYGVQSENRRRYVRLSNPKVNYTGDNGDNWMQRVEGGVLVPANLTKKGEKSGGTF